MKILKEIAVYVGIILVVIVIRTFFFTPVQVNGSSMEPTLHNNQILILNLFDKKYNRFDVVVIDAFDTKLVKRIIGLPGEHVAYINNELYVDGKKIEENYIRDEMANFDIKSLGFDKIPSGSYFVMGDNRDNSIDSRSFGPVSIEKIRGKTVFSLFPFKTFGVVK